MISIENFLSMVDVLALSYKLQILCCQYSQRLLDISNTNVEIDYIAADANALQECDSIRNRIYNIVICDYPHNKESANSILRFFTEHLEQCGLLFFNNQNNLDEKSRKDILSGLGELGISPLFERWGDIFIKNSRPNGIKRFKYLGKNMVAAIQKETMNYVIDSLLQPKLVLNIGGPQGEFCKKSYAVDIVGHPNIYSPGEYLPVRDNSVDLIFSSHSLEHMKNTKDTLIEWLRSLKIGGFLVIIVPILPYHRHGTTTKKGEQCFEEHTVEEFLEICKQLKNATIIQFDTRKNDFDLDIILQKVGD